MSFKEKAVYFKLCFNLYLLMTMTAYYKMSYKEYPHSDIAISNILRSCLSLVVSSHVGLTSQFKA